MKFNEIILIAISRNHFRFLVIISWRLHKNIVISCAWRWFDCNDDLFDITQQCYTTQCPMTWWEIRLKINWTNILLVGTLWLTINWTFIQTWILASCCINCINIRHRHLFIKYFSFWLYQFATLTIQWCT